MTCQSRNTLRTSFKRPYLRHWLVAWTSMVLGAAMESEIWEQTEILEALSSEYFARFTAICADMKPEMILMVARGSSDNAATYGRYLIETYLGIPVSLCAPSVVTRLGGKITYPPCLAIGISQSGAAPDVSEVLSVLRDQGHETLAITNTPGSRVTEAAKHSLELGVGTESSVAATKTYTASLLALYQFVRAMGGQLSPPVLPDKSWAERCREAALASLGAVLRSERWFSLARGFNYATALETCLKLMECALIPCKGFSTADFQHGPRALAGHGSVALVYGEVPSGLPETGCLIECAPDAGDGPDSPLRSILYGQFVALLAAQARGYDPDKPANLSKVTKTL